MRFIFGFTVASLGSCGVHAWFTPSGPSFSLSIDNTSSILCVGGTGGVISFFDSASPGSDALATESIGTGNVIGMKWNPVFPDILASISVENRLLVRKFKELGSMASSQAQLLRHSQQVLTCEWDPDTGTELFVGTASGYVEKYAVSFEDSADPSYASIEYDSNSTAAWFLGCRVSFIYPYNQSTTVAGCEEGLVYVLNTTNGSYSKFMDLPSSSAAPSPVSLFKGTGSNIVALFNSNVFVLDLNSSQNNLYFPVNPVEYTPSESSHILSFDVYGDIEKLAVRTTDGVAIYDLGSGNISGASSANWSRPMSLSDLISAGAIITPIVVRRSDADNEPYSTVDVANGFIDITPCWNAEAQFDPLGNKSAITCGESSPPVIAVKIALPFPFTGIQGTFEIRSIGLIPGSDCTGFQGPIVNWDDDQKNEWTKVLSSETSSSAISDCPLMEDLPRSGPIGTVDDCKSACFARPECNTVFIQLRDPEDTTSCTEENTNCKVEICNFHRCSQPNKPRAPPTNDTQIWTLVTDKRTWTSARDSVINTYGGYVAFGTEKEVIHGGCAAYQGLIDTVTSTIVNISESAFSSHESTIRFQVSQYNAEPTIRIFNLQLQFFNPFPPFSEYFVVPNSPPGGYFLSNPGPIGAPAGPILFSPDGTEIFTTSRNNSIISFTLK